jgi:ADP-heptose:LPS heptosyltransferase
MDSANMHLASLTATKVVSAWGATHPYAGFYGYNQSPDRAVQVELPCRPCSIYGNKPCYRKNNECLEKITPQMIIEKIEKYSFSLNS